MARAVRASDECAWSDTYSTDDPSWTVDCRRATRSAVRLAEDPPLSSTPPVPVGRPSRDRNHSRTSSSICEGPADSIHDPQYGLAAAAVSSARTAGQVGLRVLGACTTEHGIGSGIGQAFHECIDGRVAGPPHGLPIHCQGVLHPGGSSTAAGLTRGFLLTGASLILWLVLGVTVTKWCDHRGLDRMPPELLDYVSRSAAAFAEGTREPPG